MGSRGWPILTCDTGSDDLQKMDGRHAPRTPRTILQVRDKGPLKAKAGQRLSAERVALQIPLFEGIVRDAEITQLPIRGS